MQEFQTGDLQLTLRSPADPPLFRQTSAAPLLAPLLSPKLFSPSHQSGAISKLCQSTNLDLRSVSEGPFLPVLCSSGAGTS